MYACTGESTCKERILGIWQQLLMWKTAWDKEKNDKQPPMLRHKATKRKRRRKSLLHTQSRSLKLQLRQTRLPQPYLDILALNPHLLCANPRRCIHINPTIIS